MASAPSEPGQRHGIRAVWDVAWGATSALGGGGTDRAAAMAYYAVQALFPGLFVIVFVSLLLSTESSITAMLDWGVDQGLDPKLAQSLRESIGSAAERAGGAVSVAALIAAITAISGAAGWFAAVGRAIEPDPARRRQRNIITGKLWASLWTLVLIVLLIGALTLLAAGGEVADQLFDWLGAEGAPQVWSIVRPPLLLLGIIAAFLTVFRIAPDRISPPPMRHLLPGALVSGFGWILASLGFFFYVGNLANIGATYGAFATPIVLLLWLWLTGVVVLYGAAINDQLAERRGEHVHPVVLPGADDPEIAGHPAGRLPTAEDDER